MIGIDLCSFCKYQKNELKEGWIPCCDAYPEGELGKKNIGYKSKNETCNNGIGFEPKDEQKWEKWKHLFE